MEKGRWRVRLRGLAKRLRARRAKANMAVREPRAPPSRASMGPAGRHASGRMVRSSQADAIKARRIAHAARIRLRADRPRTDGPPGAIVSAIRSSWIVDSITGRVSRDRNGGAGRRRAAIVPQKRQVGTKYTRDGSTRFLGVYATAADAEQIDAEAAARGMSRSAFLIMAALDHCHPYRTKRGAAARTPWPACGAPSCECRCGEMAEIDRPCREPPESDPVSPIDVKP